MPRTDSSAVPGNISHATIGKMAAASIWRMSPQSVIRRMVVDDGDHSFDSLGGILVRECCVLLRGFSCAGHHPSRSGSHGEGRTHGQSTNADIRYLPDRHTPDANSHTGHVR